MNRPAQVNRPGQTLWLICITVLLAGCVSQPPPPAAIPADALLVVIDDPRPTRLRSFVDAPGYGAPIAYAADPILQRYANTIARDYNTAVVQAWPLRSLGVHCFVIEPIDQATRARLDQDPRIKWTQPFNTYTLQANPSARANSSSDNPTMHGGLPLAGTGAGTRISIIDTGVDLSHRDLMGSRIRYQDYVPAMRDDQAERHGTAVLGLIAARGADGLVHGLAPDAEVQHVRGCWEAADGQGMCNTLTLALALEAALAFQPTVLNLSLSGPRDRVLDALIAQLGVRGTIVVSAHDESRAPQERFPRPAQHVLYAMAGTTVSKHTDLEHAFVAPGQAVSLSPMNNYDLVQGHSVAAPHLTALVARLAAHQPRAPHAVHIQQLHRLLE